MNLYYKVVLNGFCLEGRGMYGCLRSVGKCGEWGFILGILGIDVSMEIF